MKTALPEIAVWRLLQLARAQSAEARVVNCGVSTAGEFCESEHVDECDTAGDAGADDGPTCYGVYTRQRAPDGRLLWLLDFTTRAEAIEAADALNALIARPWAPWQLADDPTTYGRDAGRYLVVTNDGAEEVSGTLSEGAAHKLCTIHNAVTVYNPWTTRNR